MNEDSKKFIRDLKSRIASLEEEREVQIINMKNINDKLSELEKVQVNNKVISTSNKYDHSRRIDSLQNAMSEKELTKWYTAMRDVYITCPEDNNDPTKYKCIMGHISEILKSHWRLIISSFLAKSSTPKNIKELGNDISKWNDFKSLTDFIASYHSDVSTGLTAAPKTSIVDVDEYKVHILNEIIKAINNHNVGEQTTAMIKTTAIFLAIQSKFDNVEKTADINLLAVNIVKHFYDKMERNRSDHKIQQNNKIWLMLNQDLAEKFKLSEEYKLILTENISLLSPNGYIPLNILLEKILLALQEIANTVEIATNMYKELFPNLDLTNRKRKNSDDIPKKDRDQKSQKPIRIEARFNDESCGICNCKHHKSDLKFCRNFGHPDANKDKTISWEKSDKGIKYKLLGKDCISPHLKLSEDGKKLVESEFKPKEKDGKKPGKDFIEILNVNSTLSDKNFLPNFIFNSKNALQKEQIILETLIDTGAISGNFINVENANKLMNLGAIKHNEIFPVRSGLKNLKSTQTLGVFKCIDLLYFSCKDNKNIKITLDKIHIIESSYDLIIGRKANCEYDFTEKLKPIICKDINTQSYNCTNNKNCKCNGGNEEEQDLNLLEDIKNLTPSIGSISYEDLFNVKDVHNYTEEEALETINLIEQSWIEVNKKIIDNESETELNTMKFEHTYSNQKQKIDINITPLEGIKAGDRITKDKIFKNYKSDLSYQDIADLKRSGADDDELNLDVNNIQAENVIKKLKDEKLKNDILEAIEFCGDEKFTEVLKLLCIEYIDIFAFNLQECEAADIEPLIIDIDLKKWEKDSNKRKARQMSDSKRQLIKDEIDKKVIAGIMSQSKASHWSQIHMVNKTIDTFRMCMDFRLLNECIVSSTWSMPSIQETFQDIGKSGAKYFACIDFTEGYFQLALDILSRKYTATLSHHGLHEWNRVPMGLKTSSAWFQRKMETEVLPEQVNKICKIYQDDVLVYAKTQTILVKNLREIFERCRVKNIKIKPSKLKLGGTKVEHLGHQVSGEGVTFSREKLQGVHNFERPNNSKSLQRFLGLVNWFSTHVKHKALLVRPLYELLKEFKEKKGLVWTDKAIEAFEEIKKGIWEIPTLFFIDKEKPIFLQTDASDYGISGYVFQLDEDGKEIIIGLYSKALVNHELNWSPFEKEAFAIFMSMRKFYYLLADVKFTVKTDHRNLLFMNNEASNKVINWKMQVLPFDFDIIHVPGKINVIPDVGSRGIARKDGKLEENRKPKSLEKIVEDQIIAMKEADGGNSQSLSSLSFQEYEPIKIANESLIDSKSLSNLLCDYVYADYADHNDEKITMETPILNSIELNNSLDHYKDEITKFDSKVKQVMENDLFGEINSVKLGTVPLNSAKENFKCKVLDDDRFDLISKYHNDKKGHLALWPTVRKVLENETQTHQNLARDIGYFIEQCSICQLRKKVKIKFQTKPFNTSVFGPMERISIDSVGPLPPDEKGNRYIIVFIDIFSRFITLYCVEEITSETTRRCILSHAGAYGTAAQYCMDRGKQYDNVIIDEVIKYLGSQELKTRGGSHEENGIIERANKEIIKHLTAIIHEGYVREKWAEYAPLVARIMNSIPNNSTGVAPAKIIYGINSVNLDRELLISEIKRDKNMNMSDFIKDLIKAQKVIINKALSFQNEVNDKYIKKRENDMLKRSSFEFQKDSYVLLAYETGKAPNKLLFSNSGPLRVLGRIGDNLELQNLIDDKITYHHVNLVKPFIYDPDRVNPTEISRKTAAEGAEYFVEEILDHGLADDFNDKNIKKTKKENIRFLIKWSRGEPSITTWKNMINTSKLKEYLTKMNLLSMMPKEKNQESEHVSKKPKDEKKLKNDFLPKKIIDEKLNSNNSSMEEERIEDIYNNNNNNKQEQEFERNRPQRKKRKSSRTIHQVQQGKFYVNE